MTDSGDNGGPNQLRSKLAAAQSSGGGKITFSIDPVTIVLTGGILPTITGNITIDGGNIVTISGNNATPAFQMSSGATLNLNNLTITKCLNSSGDGGALRNGSGVGNGGTININNCKFLAKQVGASFSGGGILS